MIGYILITIATFGLMECITWCTHKYIMHGFLWMWHEDHHQPRVNKYFEKNDYFFIVFAIPSIAMFALGSFWQHHFYITFIGLGILFYGIAYFLVHDIFIHQRLKWFTHSNHFYFKGLRKAHKIHHKHLDKQEGECFGMLFVPIKYFREAIKNK
jgi:beta-carotene 3-hydroxylase